MMAKRQRPHPRHSYGRCFCLHDPPNNDAISEHIEIVIVPLARMVGSLKRV
jgi:hypothetical protein